MKSNKENKINKEKAASIFNEHGKTLQELMEEAFVDYYKAFIQFDNYGICDTLAAGR